MGRFIELTHIEYEAEEAPNDFCFKLQMHISSRKDYEGVQAFDRLSDQDQCFIISSRELGSSESLKMALSLGRGTDLVKLSLLRPS